MPDTRRPPLVFKTAAKKAVAFSTGAGKTNWGVTILGIFGGRKARLGDVDAMELRLASAPDAGTPPTAEELRLLEEAREDFRTGNFTVDPATAHARPAVGRR